MINNYKWSCLALTMLASVPNLFGYDQKTTHPFMSERSVDILLRNDPSYSEIGLFASPIQAGSKSEDGIFGERGAFHFYHPPTGNGLVLYGAGFSNALETGQQAWTNALRSYMRSIGATGFADRGDAYSHLGNALHLFAQDMSSPPHVHGDAHVPHAIGGDTGPLEDKGEDLARLEIFPRGSNVQGTTLTSPLAISQTVANQTYNNSLFPGFLSRSEERGEMDLPDGNKLVVVFVQGDPVSDNPYLQEDHWVILKPLSNSVNQNLYYFPHIFLDGETFDKNKMQDWWPAFGSSTQFYVDRQDNVFVAGETLSDYLIKRCAPLGINYGAGLLKLFHDIVNEPPYVMDHVIADGSGAEVYATHVQPASGRRIISSPTGSQKLFYDKPYTVQLTFSEAVNNPSYALDEKYAAVNFQSPDGGTNWRGTLTIARPPPEDPPAPACGSPLPVSLQATDKHNHLNLPGQSGVTFGAPLDLNPATIAVRELNEPYNWIGYETAGTPSLFLPAPCGCEQEVDTAPPTITISGPNICVPSNEVTIKGHVSDNCQLKSVTVNGQAVGLSLEALAKGSASFSITFNLTDGEYVITAVATDAKNNTAASNELAFKVDTVPPRIISMKPDPSTKNVRSNDAIEILFDEELSSGEIVMNPPVSGQSIRSGRKITYQHVPLAQDQRYSARVIGVKDACGCPLR